MLGLVSLTLCSVIISSSYFPLQVFMLLALLATVPGSPLLPGLSDLSRMLETAASLLQMGVALVAYRVATENKTLHGQDFCHKLLDWPKTQHYYNP